ncbi:MAG: tetratricopeptide repeat protein [Blastocatellales bacterium]|nr:tetratricopeptide repeat protein [Blastocatellales bacterium]
MDGVRQEIYRSTDFEIDPALASLRLRGNSVHLRPKTFQVLIYLVEHRDRLITKEELIERLWPGIAVTDDAVVQCIVDLRRALGDDPRQPKWIKTIPKVGYRFIGEVEVLPSVGAGSIEIEEVSTVDAEVVEYVEGVLQTPSPASPTSVAIVNRRFQVMVAAALGVAVIAAALWIWRERSPVVDAALTLTPGKRPLAVLHFENRSRSAALDWLREGLADMLITGLSRSRNLSVLSRPQLAVLLDRIGHASTESITLAEGVDLARRANAEFFIAGAFSQLGERIRVDLRCHDGRDGSLVFTEGLIVDRPEQLLTEIDLLAFKIASRVAGDAPAREQQPSSSGAGTTSLEAFRYYSLALERTPALDNISAIELLEKAVALDPEFAMAHARIGYAYAVTWVFAEKARPHLERAYRLAHRLTEKEKHYVRAWYAIANLDFEYAMEPLRAVIALDPREVEAYRQLAVLLEGEDRFEEAIEVLKRALIIDPEAKNIYNTLGFLYADIGDHANAEAMIRRHAALAPREPNAWNSLGLVLDWAGRYEDAIAAYERSFALDPNFDLAIVHLGNTYFHQGRYAKAIEQYRRFIDRTPTQIERARGWGRIAWVYIKKGDRARAEDAARRESRLEPTALFNSVMLALEIGDVNRADELLKRSEKFAYTSRGSRTSRRYPAYFRGAVALRSERTDEAIASFRAVLGYRPPIWAIDVYEDCLANALLEIGRYDEAIAEYERILRLNPRYPLLHFHMAQAYRGKGDTARADEYLRLFQEMWKDADADIPAVRASAIRDLAGKKR